MFNRFPEQPTDGIADHLDQVTRKECIPEVENTKSEVDYLSACAILNWARKSTLLAKQWFSRRNICPNQLSFWCGIQSLMNTPFAKPSTRFLIASLRIRRYQPTQGLVLRQRLSKTTKQAVM
ncbi:hypothetical protein CSKR_103735 [Clonorchis sinensis]|uniref:Uncharacterized protein n=1 Tax=Clonorchis sinensis TaxID=79923 RepID=A0A419QEG9_CLOSI|nr:hypothetical protein CSKR_103735 [Clonorchis sinensis]